MSEQRHFPCRHAQSCLYNVLRILTQRGSSVGTDAHRYGCFRRHRKLDNNLKGSLLSIYTSIYIIQHFFSFFRSYIIAAVDRVAIRTRISKPKTQQQHASIRQQSFHILLLHDVVARKQKQHFIGQRDVYIISYIRIDWL